MNNNQFRRLLFENNSKRPSAVTASSQGDAAAPSSLGSRMRSSIPMTPRAVTGSSASADFARQLREANAPPPAKKFKSTPAPKGTKLAAGYVDRSRTRDDSENDDIAKRIKALEEMVKLGQMEQEAFEKVRDELIGGDIKNVYLVKGLDRKLLERARRGEDVYSTPAKEEKTRSPSPEQNEEDIDDALDAMKAKDIVPITRTKVIDESNTIARKKRTRDDILREMKEARAKAAESAKPAQPALGSKFKKVAEKMEPGTSRLEIDEQGREVLIIMDMNGNIKRKVKKSKPVAEVPAEKSSTKEVKRKLDKVPAPLGADVVIPDKPIQPEESEEDEDIFADAGTDYDPLAGLDGTDSESGPEDGEAKFENISNSMPPPARLAGPRNYFNEKPKQEDDSAQDPARDPEFLAAIRKAASVADRINKSDDLEEGLEDDEEKLKKLARRKQMLQSQDRDDEDLDYGFGSSRFEDQEDGEDNSFKLSKWTGGAGEDDGKGHGGSNKQKRGPKKKKKGDKNSATDVLAVLERRAKG